MNLLKNLYLFFLYLSYFEKLVFLGMLLLSIVVIAGMLGNIILKLTGDKYIKYKDCIATTISSIVLITLVLGIVLIIFPFNFTKQNGLAVKTTETSNGLKDIPIPAKVDHLEAHNMLSKNPKASGGELVIRFDNGQKLMLSNSKLNGSNTSDKYSVYYGNGNEYPRSKFESSNKYLNVKAIQLGKNTNWDDLKPGTKLKISRIKYEPANWVYKSNQEAVQPQLKKYNSDKNMTLVVTKKD